MASSRSYFDSDIFLQDTDEICYTGAITTWTFAFTSRHEHERYFTGTTTILTVVISQRNEFTITGHMWENIDLETCSFTQK